MHCFRQALFLLVMLFCLAAVAEQEAASPSRFVADIELQTEADLSALLVRAEQLLLDGGLTQQEGAVVLVLHGPVLRSLLRNNYVQSKTMVDQAASLSALGVLEVKACRSWMGQNDIDERQLQPFVQVVSFGPAEVSRLVEDEGYIEF